MVSDTNVDKVYQYAIEMKCAVHIYVEHKIKCNAQEADVGDFQEDDVDGVEQDEVGNDVGGVENGEEGNVGGVEKVEEAIIGGVEQVEEGNVAGVKQVEEAIVGDVEQVEVCQVIKDSEDNEFEVDGLSFDDCEDERDLGMDDCFDVIENQDEENSKRGRIKVATRKHKHTLKRVTIGFDNVGSSSYVDNEIDINYASDKLGSSDPIASDEVNEPKYPKFKMQELEKNYKFKMGLEFVSL
ncbi:unnamed protein product [Lathyrus sativus]|nr:unnamed protein product [Lathyrus sativus]